MKTISERVIEEFLKSDPRKEVAFSEGCIVDWFEKNYKSLGFDRILKKQWNKTPDFIMLKNGQKVGVEIEYLASDFIKHKHDPSTTDLVICCYEDTKLKGVKTIALDYIFIPYYIEIYPKIDLTKKQFSPDELRSLVSGWERKDDKK